MIRVVALLTLVVVLQSCRTAQRTLPIKGQVVAVAANKRSVTIAHEAIPGYMEAMTMPYPVKDTRILESVDQGDEIQGELTVTDSEGWVSRLTVTKKGEQRSTVDRSKALPIKYLLQPGNDVPQVQLIDQDERKFRLSDLQGQVVALTFIFTRCPLPNFCPLMSKRFVEAQTLLKDRDQSLLARTKFLTVSFDPEHDTPEVLKAYGHHWAADFDRWTFATGSLQDIAEFSASFGLSFWSDEGTINHSLATAVIGPDGKLQSVFRGNEWKAEDLIKEIQLAASR